MPITAEEFEAEYAKRSGMTVDRLREFRTVRPCHCEEDGCEGWQSISYARAAELESESRPSRANSTTC